MNAQDNRILAGNTPAGYKTPAGQAEPTYVPTTGAVGHRLGCRVTVTYPLRFRLNRRERRCTRPVMLHGTTVINGGAGADERTFTGKVDGRALVPGSYRLLATPTTDGIAGQEQQTTFETTH